LHRLKIPDVHWNSTALRETEERNDEAALAEIASNYVDSTEWLP
jgi:hypothetical protein